MQRMWKRACHVFNTYDLTGPMVAVIAVVIVVCVLFGAMRDPNRLDIGHGVVMNVPHGTRVVNQLEQDRGYYVEPAGECDLVFRSRGKQPVTITVTYWKYWSTVVKTRQHKDFVAGDLLEVYFNPAECDGVNITVQPD